MMTNGISQFLWEYIALEDYETNEADYNDEFDSDADEAWEMFYDSFTY